MTLHHPCQDIGAVIDQVPSISHLYCTRGTQPRPTCILVTPITGHDFDAWVCLKPGSKRLGGSIGEEFNWTMLFEIDKDRPVALSLAFGPIIDTEHAWCGMDRKCRLANEP
jgi:hypothetical protein